MKGLQNIEEALKSLGAGSDVLSEVEKEQLDRQGYVVFPGLMGKAMVDALRDKYEELITKEGQSAGKEVHQEEGTRRLSVLVNKGSIFDAIYTNPKVLAAVYHVLKREFKLSSL